MTAKNVRCADCKFCDPKQCWCRLKAMVVTVNSIRNCKIYAAKNQQ